jgi:hypothetical protein
VQTGKGKRKRNGNAKGTGKGHRKGHRKGSGQGNASNDGVGVSAKARKTQAVAAAVEEQDKWISGGALPGLLLVLTWLRLLVRKRAETVTRFGCAADRTRGVMQQAVVIVERLSHAELEHWMDAGVDMLASSTLEVVAGDALKSTTAKGTDNRVRAWGYYVSYFHAGGKRASLQAEVVYWPPSWDSWRDFMAELRPLVKSQQQFRQIVDNICSVGRQLAVNGHAAAGAAGHKGPPGSEAAVDARRWDPRHMYSAKHDKAMRSMLRHYGQGNTFTRALSRNEARNGGRFVDRLGLRGVMTGGMFAIGAKCGRRARTVVEIRLADLHVKAESVVVGGASVLVPSVTIAFRDEKFMDQRGTRSLSEPYKYKTDYDDLCLKGWSDWIYRSLVMRGAFQSHDPILCAAQDGAELPIRAECKDWFLFCFSQSNEVYCDTEPCSTHCASRRVGAVLRGMGGPHGTFGSFRKGLATNAVAMNIIEKRGKKYDTGVTDLLARIGGWDILLGYKTLNQHYISKAVDSCVDLFGFAMGRDWMRQSGSRS